jgi:hypothetical protein
MDWRVILEFLVVAGALAMGARMGGVGLGLWGAVGLLVLVVGFDVAPANIPGEVLLIVLTVIIAPSSKAIGRLERYARMFSLTLKLYATPNRSLLIWSSKSVGASLVVYMISQPAGWKFYANNRSGSVGSAGWRSFQSYRFALHRRLEVSVSGYASA